MPKFLGIDLGRRRIGVAVSDDDGKIALPGGVIEVPPCGSDENCARAAAKRIAAKARQVGAKNIVVGLPLLLSGESSPMTKFARQVGEILRQKGFDVHFWDERFTSAEAERYIRDAGKKPSRNRGKIDEVAAVLILQTFLDSVNLTDYDPL